MAKKNKNIKSNPDLPVLRQTGKLKEEFYKGMAELQIFYEYKNFGVIGCVCALGYGSGLKEYAERKGLFVMKPVKGIMDIINKPNFKIVFK